MLGKFALSQFKKVAGTLSETERVALESGTVGYEASIFSGKPDWKGLMSTPAPQLTAEEQSFVDNETEQLCALINDWKVRKEDHDLSPETWDFLKKNKFFGMIIPKEYGGLGFSAQAHAAVIAKIASRSSTGAATSMVPNSLGPAELLHNYGTKEQKDYYLPRLADGREIPCFSLTSEKAGSDATSMEDEGVVFKGDDGKLYLRLNWSKRYITLAPIATLMGLAFQLRDPDHLLGDKEDIGITVALVPANTPGISRDFRHNPIGGAFLNGPHWGKDVVVPVDAIIGGPEQAGKGWNMLVDCLSVGRSISLPASSSGIGRTAVRTAGAYSAVRQQFGFPLSSMEGVQESLARIGGLAYMIDAARTLPLQDLDLAHEAGEKARPAIASAILKYHTTEAARQIAVDSMDVHAGKGVMEGPDNPAAPLYEGVPVAITVEGANILTRNLIIFGQGAFLAHPYTLPEIKAADNDDKKTAGRLLVKHMANVFNNAARGVFLGLTGGRFSAKPRSGPDARFYQQINRLASVFSFAGNASMLTLQSDLKRMQRISALLGDGFSHLYIASQVLRRWDLEGRKKEDKPLMEWAATYCLYKAEQALYEAIDNSNTNIQVSLKQLPTVGKWGVTKTLGKLADKLGAYKIPLKLIAFPRGRLHKKPSHDLDAKVAALISTPGEARERLTRGMYVPTNKAEYIARLDRAFELSHKALPHEQALTRLVKEGRKAQYKLDKVLNKLTPKIETAIGALPAAYVGAASTALTNEADLSDAVGNVKALVATLKGLSGPGVLSAKETSHTVHNLLRSAAETQISAKGNTDAAAIQAKLNKAQDHVDQAVVQAGLNQRNAVVSTIEKALKDGVAKKLLKAEDVDAALAMIKAEAKSEMTASDYTSLITRAVTAQVKARTLSQTDDFGALVQQAVNKELITADIADLLIETHAARADIIRADYVSYQRPAHHRTAQDSPAPHNGA